MTPPDERTHYKRVLMNQAIKRASEPSFQPEAIVALLILGLLGVVIVALWWAGWAL